MNDCTFKAEGFHVNSKEKCDTFLLEDTIIEPQEDENWLGIGMYFWDNEGDTNYWARKKYNENIKTVISVKTIICLDKTLDLTNDDVLSGMLRLWKKHCENSNDRNNQGYGIIIDKLYNIFYKKIFDVIKGHGNYPRKVELFRITNKKTPHLTSSTKTIYCVKNKKAILKKEFHKKFINIKNYEHKRTITNTTGIY